MRVCRILVLVSALTLVHMPLARATSYTWALAGSATTYNWDSSASWNPNTGFPNGTADTATLNTAASDISVNLNQTITLGGLSSTTGTLTLGTGTAGSFIFDNGNGSLDTVIFSATLRYRLYLVANMQLNDHLDLTYTSVNNSSAPYIRSVVSGAGNLKISYGSSATLSLGAAGGAANTHAGGTTLIGLTSVRNVSAAKAEVVGSGTLSLNRINFNLAGFSQTFAGLDDGANNAVLSSASGTPTVTLNGGGTYSFGGQIQNGIKLTKTGAGTQTFTAAQTYTGLTTISDGTLALSGAGGLADTGAVTVNGAAAKFDLGGGSDTVGAVTLSNGEIKNGTLTGASFVVNPAVGVTATISANLAGAAATMTKRLAGTVILSGINSYGGATSIERGTLSINSIANADGVTASALGAPAAGNGTIKIGSGTLVAALEYTGGTATTDRPIDLAGTVEANSATITQSGTGLLKFTSDFTATGVGAKTLTLKGSTSGAGEIGGAIVDSSGGATTVAKTGTGMWTLSGANAYTGGTTISGGTLSIGSGGPGGSVVGDIMNNAALEFNRSDDSSYAGIISGSGTLTKKGAGKLSLSAASSYGGGTEVQNGTLELAGGTLADAGAIHVNGVGARFDLGGGSETVGAVTLTDGQINNGTLTGTGYTLQKGAVGAVLAGATSSLIKDTAGTVTLSNANTYGGGTTVNAGRLVVSGSIDGGATVNGGALIANGTVGGTVTVNNGGTLGGSGSLSGATAIASGGVLSPGNSPGQLTHESGLTLANGSTYVWELVTNDNTGLPGSDYDQEVITGGDLVVDPGATLSLVFNSAGSSVDWSNLFWADPHQWVVMDFTSTGTSSGNFGTVNVSLDSGDQNLADIRPEYMFTAVRSGNNLLLNYDVIPEPATVGMLLTGMFGMALRRRRLQA